MISSSSRRLRPRRDFLLTLAVLVASVFAAGLLVGNATANVPPQCAKVYPAQPTAIIPAAVPITYTTKPALYGFTQCLRRAGFQAS